MSALTQTDSLSSSDLLVISKTDSGGAYRGLPTGDLMTYIEDNITLPGSNYGPRTLTNLAIGVSVASGALTLTLNQGDGVTAPDSTSGSYISFETLNTDSGSFTTVQVTSRLTLTIPATATMGMANTVLDKLHVYLLNNAGSPEIAVSTEALWSEGLYWSTTAISTGSTSRVTLYSNTARVGVSIRLIAVLTITEATAGTWATMPTSTESTLATRSGVIANITPLASPTSLTTNTPVNIASITLPAGTWDINAGYGFVPTATTSTTDLVGAVSLVSATLPSATVIGNLPALTDPTYRDRVQHISPTVWVSTGPITKIVPEFRHISTASKTVYLVIQATFTASTLTGFGWIQARKVN